MSAHQTFPRLKVAAVQASSVVRDAPEWFDLAATLDKAVSLTAEAGRNGARLIVFPECWLPGYTCWSLDLADRSGFDEIWANFLWNSVEVPGPETKALREAAKKAGAYLVIGINERDKVFPGRMYNSILYIGPNGEVIGTHRKICITVQERFFHTQGDGGENLRTVFDTEIGKIGGSICGEHTQLPLMYNWIMQGVQIHCSLWPGKTGLSGSTDLLTRAMCRIGHCFGVLSATYFADKDMPKNFYKNCSFNTPGSIRGGSGVIGPNGNYIVGPVYGEETIIYADIDLAELDKSRFATNLTGYYSRWDILNLNVRQGSFEPVQPMLASEVGLPVSESSQTGDLAARVKQLEQQIAVFLAAKGQDTGKKTEGCSSGD